MRTQALKTLATIAKVGSFAKTAESLNSTLSTVSMQMKGLETELGCTLFDRHFRPPMLNPLGRKVANQAMRMLDLEAELLKLCAGGQGLYGQYRLGFIATPSVRLLPAFMRNAATKTPDAQFLVETGLSETLEMKVLSGQLDAAIVTASDKPPANLCYTPIRVEPLVFAIPGSASGKTIEKVAEEMAFLQFNPSSGIGKLIESFVGDQLSGIKETIILDSVEAIMECVNQGIGFTLLAQADAERYGNSETRFVRLENRMPVRHLVLVTPDHEPSHSMRDIIVRLFD